MFLDSTSVKTQIWMKSKTEMHFNCSHLISTKLKVTFAHVFIWIYDTNKILLPLSWDQFHGFRHLKTCSGLSLRLFHQIFHIIIIFLTSYRYHIIIIIIIFTMIRELVELNVKNNVCSVLFLSVIDLHLSTDAFIQESLLVCESAFTLFLGRKTDGLSLTSPELFFLCRKNFN